MNYINTFFFTELAVQQNETKLNKLANICFSPLHYWKGRTVQCSRVSVSSYNSFQPLSPKYSPRLILDELRQENSKTWIKTLLAVALFVPAILVGSVFKTISLMDKQTREMFCRASSEYLNRCQLLANSTIYLPPNSDLSPNHYRFTLSQPIGYASSTASVEVEKINVKDRSFGIVIHYNGLTSKDKIPFYSVQLANPTESKPKKSFWGRVTHPIQHNFTGEQCIEELTSIRFEEKSPNTETNPMRVIKVFATHTNPSITSRFYARISQEHDREISLPDYRDHDYPESEHAFGLYISKK